jgi:thiamine-monophosphate kinase
VNEFDLIRWIRSQVADSPDVAVGIGDDCAALRLPAGKVLLVTTDMVIAGVHFDPRTATAEQVGHKAIARGLSDIAAMAGDASAVVVAMAAPRSLSQEFFREMFHGMKAVADAFGVRIVGGDISTGEFPLTLTVTAFGTGAEGALALRSGARPGDAVLVTGELGGSILGRHLSFLPRLKEAQWLRASIPIHAMIDVSDGLASDAAHVSEESRAGIEFREEAIPVSRAAEELARTSGRTALEHALHDGEDYELLFTAAAEDAEALLRRTDRPVRVTRVGEVTSGAGLWIRSGAGRRRLAPKGWVHEF